MEKWEVKVWLLVAQGAADKAVYVPDRYASEYRNGYVSGIYDVLKIIGHRAEVELDPNRIDMQWIYKTRREIDRAVDREMEKVFGDDYDQR